MRGEEAALYRISVETGEATQITFPPDHFNDSSPAISPDGRNLLFSRHGNVSWGRLYRMRLDADSKPEDEPRLVETGSHYFGQWSWSEDGRQIFAISYDGMLRLPAEGSDEPEHLAIAGFSVNLAAIARSGHRMVYSALYGDTNIWRIDLKARIPQPERLIASTYRDVFPKYSPDGRQLAFYSGRTGAQFQVWISDADGQQSRQLTFFDGQAGSPVWSPDQQKLAVDATDKGLWQIYELPVHGGKLRQLTFAPSTNFGAAWSHDGRWMYFTSNRTGRDEIWRMPDGGGPAVQVTVNGAERCQPSNDGAALIYSKREGTGSIWKMPLVGGPEQKLAESVYRTNFVMRDKELFWMTAQGVDGRASLRVLDLDTNKSRKLLDIGRPEYGLDVSPDGRYLAYAQLDNPTSNLMLIENLR